MFQYYISEWILFQFLFCRCFHISFVSEWICLVLKMLICLVLPKKIIQAISNSEFYKCYEQRSIKIYYVLVVCHHLASAVTVYICRIQESRTLITTPWVFSLFIYMYTPPTVLICYFQGLSFCLLRNKFWTLSMLYVHLQFPCFWR